MAGPWSWRARRFFGDHRLAIAVAYAVRHPDRVTHLVLHGGYARGRYHRGLDRRAIEEAELTIRLVEVGWGQENAAFRQFFTTELVPDGTAEQHRWFNDLARITTSPANAARFLRVFYGIDVTSLLPSDNADFGFDNIAASLKTSADHGIAAGLLKPVDLEGIYDLRLLREVLSARGAGAVDDAGLGRSGG